MVSNGTYYFEFISTNAFSRLSLNIDIFINLPPNTQIQSLLGFFPVIVVVFFISLGLILIITKFRLKRSKVVEYNNNKPIHEPITPVIEVANKKIPSEVLQKYWYCPPDHSRLQLVTSKVAGNLSFIVLKERINIGINNAIP